MKLWFLKVLLVASAVCLSACDPGHGSTAGIEGTGSPTTVGGSVTSYGSVYVNGVHIRTEDAQIYVNGKAADETDLKLGMVVQVELEDGAVLDETAVAKTIRYRRSLRGSVTEVREHSDVRKALMVLGQLLVVYDDAVFDGLKFEDLEPGVTLDVSGFNDEQGRLIAARVANSSETSPEVRGVVANLDRDRARFDLGVLTVDYTNSLFESGERDLLVEGEGVRLLGGEIEGAVFRPEVVEIESAFESEEESLEGHRVSQEGLIDVYESDEQFIVSGIRVDASGVSLGNAANNDLALGMRVVVSGLMVDEVLKAAQLRVVLPGVDRVRAAVDRVNPDTDEIVVLGETYTVSNLTGYEDRAQGRRVMNLGEIFPGDVVEVHARATEEGRSATRIKRIDAEEDMILRGPVTRLGSNSITVMGVEVSLSEVLDAEVLADLRSGDRVQITGSGTSDGFTAATISLSPLPQGRGPCPPAIVLECDEATRFRSFTPN